MLPDERDAIAERAGDLDELYDAFLSTDEPVDKLDFDRE